MQSTGTQHPLAGELSCQLTLEMLGDAYSLKAWMLTGVAITERDFLARQAGAAEAPWDLPEMGGA